MIAIAGLLVLVWAVLLCIMIIHSMSRREPVTETYTIPHGPYNTVHINNREHNYDRQVVVVFSMFGLLYPRFKHRNLDKLCWSFITIFVIV